MDFYKIVAVGVVCALAIVYLKSVNNELAIMATIASGMLLTVFAVSYVSDFLSLIVKLSEYAQIGGLTVKIVLKVIAIGYLVEFSADLIEDMGLKSLSDKVVFAGKILVLTVSFPIIESLIKLVVELI